MSSATNFPSLHLRHNSFSNPSVARAHSPNIPSLHLRLNSFSDPSVARAHSPNFPSLHVRHNSFSNLSVARDHSANFPSLHLRYNSFSNPSVALPTSQLILQPLCCFTYVTAHSPTLLSLLLRHRFFTYVIWRAAHAWFDQICATKSTLPVGLYCLKT